MINEALIILMVQLFYIRLSDAIGRDRYIDLTFLKFATFLNYSFRKNPIQSLRKLKRKLVESIQLSLSFEYSNTFHFIETDFVLIINLTLNLKSNTTQMYVSYTSSFRNIANRIQDQTARIK